MSNRPAYMDDGRLYTAYVGDNSEVLARILQVFVSTPALVADVTFNAGNFWRGRGAAEAKIVRLPSPDDWTIEQLNPEGLAEWRKIEQHWPSVVWDGTRPNSGLLVIASDILMGIDCRRLPYADSQLDAVVFDPPYAGTGGSGTNPCRSCGGTGVATNSNPPLSRTEDEADPPEELDPSSPHPCGTCAGSGKTKASGSDTIRRFGNAVLGSRSTKQILELYRDGLVEARRVLRPNGVCIVKVQDQIESGKQVYLSHAVINAPDWVCEGDIMVVSPNAPRMRHGYQLHARRNHSVFVVLRKPRQSKPRA